MFDKRCVIRVIPSGFGFGGEGPVVGQREDGGGQEERLADNSSAIEAQDDVGGNIAGDPLGGPAVLVKHDDEVDELGAREELQASLEGKEGRPCSRCWGPLRC